MEETIGWRAWQWHHSSWAKDHLPSTLSQTLALLPKGKLMWIYTALPIPSPHLSVAQDTTALIGQPSTLGHWAELARGLERLDHSQTFLLHAQPCPLGIKDSWQSLSQRLALPEHN